MCVYTCAFLRLCSHFVFVVIVISSFTLLFLCRYSSSLGLCHFVFAFALHCNLFFVFCFFGTPPIHLFFTHLIALPNPFGCLLCLSSPVFSTPLNAFSWREQVQTKKHLLSPSLCLATGCPLSHSIFVIGCLFGLNNNNRSAEFILIRSNSIQIVL
jgi:hypothetical protein